MAPTPAHARDRAAEQLMALPPTFTARVRTSVVQQAPRRIGGSGVADGLSMLGRVGAEAVERDRRVTEAEEQSAFRIEQEEQRRERSRRAIGFGAALAEARIDYAKRAEELRGQAEPGAPGWEARSRELVAEVFAPLAGSFTDDEELALHLAPQLQAVTAGIVADEAAWEAQQRTTWEGEQFETTLQAEADAVLGDPGKADEAEERLFGILALTDFDGTTKAKLARLVRRTIRAGQLDGMIQAGQFDQVDAVLQAGTLDGMLGDDKQSYLRTVAAGRQAQAREAEIAASEARDAAREGLDLIEVLIDNGEPVPQSRIDAAINAAKAAGVDADEIAGAAFLGERAVNQQQFRTMGDAALQDEVTALGAIEASGRLDAAGQRRLEQAEAALGKRDGAKAENLGTLWRTGPEGQAQVLEQLRTMPPDRRFAAGGRIEGADNLGLLASLPPQVGATALEGKRRRADDPGAFMPQRGAGKPDAKLAEARFNAIVGDRLRNALGGGGQLEPALQAALDYYVGSQARGGGSGGWSERAFAKAVNVVFGATERSDGTVQGGIGTVRGRTVELPPRWTAAELDARLSRQDFAALGARYADLSNAIKTDVLVNYQPIVQVDYGNGEVSYRFENAAGQALVNADGRLWTLRMPSRPGG
jgi:hypothetical protein